MSASSVEKIPHGEAPDDSTTMTIPSRPSIDGENEKPKHRREDSTVSSHDDDTHSDTHYSLGSMEEIAAEDVENAPTTRTKSRSSSVRSKAVTIIERQHRRGLLGQFSYIPEVTRPVEYTRRTKWIITMTVALAAAAAPQGSAIFFRASQTPQLFQLGMKVPILIRHSCPPTNRRRVQHHRHRHQPLRRPLHALHVHLPPLVVLLQRNPGSTDHIPLLLPPLLRLVDRLRSRPLHRHTNILPRRLRRQRSGRPGCRCRHYSRHVGQFREGSRNGDFLPRPTHGAIIRTHHWGCYGASLWVA